MTIEKALRCACGHICDHGPHETELDHEPEAVLVVPATKAFQRELQRYINGMDEW